MSSKIAEITKEIQVKFGSNTEVSVSEFRGGWSVKMSNGGLEGGGGFAGGKTGREIADELAKTYWPWWWSR